MCRLIILFLVVSVFTAWCIGIKVKISIPNNTTKTVRHYIMQTVEFPKGDKR